MASIDFEADEEALLKFAQGGTMDYASWPQLLSSIIARLDKIAHNDFPIPHIPPPPTSAPAPSLPSSDPVEPPSSTNPESTGSGPSASSQETNKENANPAPSSSAATTTSAAAPEPAPDRPPAQQQQQQQQQRRRQRQASAPAPGTLPPQIAAMLAEITTTLTDGFPTRPPHTMQRLAELLLAPRQHYRSLPSYLHAVDRVVHVTSGMDVYPLPPAVPDMSAMSQLANGRPGSAGAPAAPAVGSDEALGGALLTPIPWLQRRSSGGEDQALSPVSDGSSGGGRGLSPAGQGQQFQGQVRTESTETIEGPNGIGSIETVSVSVNGIPSTGAGGVAQQQQQQPRALTQGEILREEQRAGVVPVTQLARSSPAATTTAGPVGAGAAAHLVHLHVPSGGGRGTSPNAAEAEAAAEDEDMADDENEDGDGPDADDEEEEEEGGGRGAEHEDEDDEVPHARGPAEIGAADTGPQSATTSFVVGSSAGGGVQLHGIDVEAAVGRRAEHPARSSRSPEDRPPQEAGGAAAAKRGAGGSPGAGEEGGPAQKRLREEQEEGGPPAPGPKRDAEGDIELADEAGGPPSSDSSATLAGDGPARDDDGSKTADS